MLLLPWLLTGTIVLPSSVFLSPAIFFTCQIINKQNKTNNVYIFSFFFLVQQHHNTTFFFFLSLFNQNKHPSNLFQFTQNFLSLYHTDLSSFFFFNKHTTHTQQVEASDHTDLLFLIHTESPRSHRSISFQIVEAHSHTPSHRFSVFSSSHEHGSHSALFDSLYGSRRTLLDPWYEPKL
ncbi:hypothetical protein HanHA300_Chr16g0601691 [Helianthus annuus]|nr:hypothetical protein HanHA300_Chr16g0601691 [Helianthus annuus]KAJ0459716.1 hypothetical protein HanHA89_Chr16g0652211 [Helianthus annuus]